MDSRSSVMNDQMTCGNSDGIRSSDAVELAGITYRQLDHWAHQAWVVPSIDPGCGRGGRRLYSTDDVLRLAAMRHFAAAGWPVESLGNQIGLLDIGANRFLVAGTQSGLTACDTPEDLLGLLRHAEKFAVYDTKPLRHAVMRP